MKNIKFDSMIIVLYNILKKYDTFVDAIWEEFKDENITEYYGFYESEIFGKDQIDIEKEIKIHILNACLYVNNNIIPIIVKEKKIEELYLNTRIKIDKYKTRLREQVAIYLSQNNNKKYILKELESKESNDPKKFINSRLSKIRKWETDPNSLISEFYYIDELQKNQLKIIYYDESVFILLNEIYKYNNQSLMDNINLLKSKELKAKKRGATIPNSMFEYDGIFSAGKKTVKDLAHFEKDNNIHVKINKNDDQITIAVPKVIARDERINAEYNSEIDSINFTAADFKVLTSLFELGRNRLLEGKETVSFTMESLCNMLDIVPCTTNYNTIAKSIFAFKTKSVYIKISDSYVRFFNIIKTIDVPFLNSDRKKQWTISFHEELVKEIVANKYKYILTETISSLKHEISVLLFKIIIYDVYAYPKKTCFSYTWDEIALKVGLDDKPNRIKNRIKMALNEMNAAGIIMKYETRDKDSVFNIFPNPEII